MKNSIYFILVFIFSAVFSCLHAQEYDTADITVLKAIRDNAPSISPLKTEWAIDANVGSWAGVSWTGTAPRKVYNLTIPSKNLISLDVSGLTGLQTLMCYSNLLTSIDVSGLSNLSILNITGNNIPLSKMPLPNPSYSIYSYQSQNKIFEEKNIAPGVEINYSSEQTIDGTPTTFTWWKNDQVVGSNTSSFTPAEPGWYFCKMTNDKFPGLIETTNTIKVGEPTVPEFDPVDVAWLKTIRDNAPGGTPLKTEWADAVPVKLWTGIYWTDNYPKKATSLTLISKGLQSLDVTGLPMLLGLNCSSNQITLLKITGLTSLGFLNCGNNQLSSLDVAGFPILRILFCYNNQLSSLDASGLPMLSMLYCYNNNLSSLNVTGSTNLQQLHCYNNRLTSLNVAGLTNLRMLYFNMNKIPFSAMPLPKPGIYWGYFNNPQNKIFDEKVICLGDVIDYSSEATIDGAATNFSWYKNGLLIPGTDQSGKYTSTLDGNYYCMMTNPKFPGLTLTTNTVTVDKISPSLSCPPALTTPCSITEVPPYSSFAAFKAAGGSATDTGGMGVSETSFAFVGDADDGKTCPKTVTRTYKIADLCGNTSTCTQTIIIHDKVPPVMVLHEICVYLTNEGKWYLNTAEKLAITKDITDNCTAFKDLILTINPLNFDCNDVLKQNPVVVTATDKCNNTSTATVNVIVADTIKPVAKCQNVTTYLDSFGQAYVVQGQVNAGNNTTSPAWAKFFSNMKGGSYDNCEVKELHLSRQLFTCSDVGKPAEVILSVVDPSGNVGTCKSIITVHDTLVPVITQALNITMTVAPGVCSTKVTYPEIVVKDNCPTTLERTAGLGANGNFPLGTTTETWRATDVGGKSATMSFTVTINTYNAPPTIDDLADITVNEDGASFDVPLSGIGYGVDCVPQKILSVTGYTNNSSLVKVSTTYTLGAPTGKLTLTLFPNKYGEAIIQVIVGDDGGSDNGGYYKVQKTFKLTVLPVNDPPVATPIYDQYVTLPNALSVNVKSAFSDVDEGDVLTLKVTKADGSPLPSWMQFTSEAGFLKGIPALANLGVTDLKAVASDKSGATASVVFKVIVLDPNASTIKGIVKKSGTLLTAGIRVVLFAKEGNIYKMVDQTILNNTGGYYFYNVPKGTFLTKAEITDAVLNSGLLNTYHLSATSVFQATSVVIAAIGTYYGDINMVQRELQAGNFKISGKVVRKTGTPELITQGKDPVATPAAGVDLVLKQNGVVVANTVTGSDGYYSFPELPAGTYDVFVEVPGYTQNVTQKVILDASNPLKNKVDFTIWTGTNSFVITDVKDLNNDFGFKLYPNPTSGKVNIELTWNDMRKVDVMVYNILGVEVFRNQYTPGNQITIDMSGQSTGIYLVKLNAEGQSFVRKLTLDRK